MQPKIYSISDHQIPPNKIDHHAYYVIQKLRKNGFIAYLVGGSVRDLLLNRRPKDFDISTSARPEEIKKIFRNCLLIGRRFRLAHVRFGKKVLEVSTFRAGDTEDTGLILRDNIWGSPEEDVLRRDFTINGLFYDPEEQHVIDYVGGYEDANKKVLKTIGTALVRFRQDPVRMIRLIKFHARFDFEIDKEATDALYQCKKDIMKSSPARILEELLRMLESGSSEPFFRYLFDFGLLDLLLPSLAKYYENNGQNNEISKYLSEVDNISWKDFSQSLQRPILLACLLYPLLSDRLQKLKKKNIHLGIIAQMAKGLIGDVFLPFFQISRKMSAIIISILTAQYRFVPLQEKFSKKIRIPKDPFFDLAMKFFKIRTVIEPDLLKTYTHWSEIVFNRLQVKAKKHAKSKSH